MDARPVALLVPRRSRSARRGPDPCARRRRSSRACRCTSACARRRPASSRAIARVVGGVPPRRSGGVAARREPEVRGAHRARRRAGRVRDLPHQVGAGRTASPQSQVRVVEALAATPAAERELWRFVFGIDLTSRVEGRCRPGIAALPDGRRRAQPATACLARASGCGSSTSRRALAGRSYATDDDVVLDVRDDVLSVECRPLARRPGDGAHGR